MKKLQSAKMEALEGGRAFSKLFTINGQKLVFQANCSRRVNGFFINNVGQGNGNAANVLHLTGGLGSAWLFQFAGVNFVLDCTDNGSPDIFLF